jgi:hypothetical protein
MHNQDRDNLVDKQDLTSRIEFKNGSNQQTTDQNSKTNES